MNSEKVKEIKKALEHCGEKVTCQGCPEYNNEPVVDWFECKKNLLQKTITLINELESENERLLESCKNCHHIKDLEIANGHAKELKDRIAELEKENEKWQRKASNYYQMAKSYGVECIIDSDIDEILKEFINES